MKTILSYLLSSILFFSLYSCSTEESEGYISLSETSLQEVESFDRLNFSNAEDLRQAILKGSNPNLITRNGKRFINLFNEMPTSRNMHNEPLTYYEALGYDTIVPNPEFAQLLNPKGEIEIGTDLIRITPEGTYKISLEFQDSLDYWIENYAEIEDNSTSLPVISINSQLSLFKFTHEQPGDYLLIGEANYDLIDDNYFNETPNTPSVDNTPTTSNEPDFSSFQTFSADKKTWIGKIIQNIIGSSKNHTINFSSNRRVRGSFYFMNYANIYEEIGVKGWTDKKNWIGWSKTACDEMRVGWKQVILKKTINDSYKESMKTINNMVYYNPQYIEVNGQKVNVATLAMPEFIPELKDKVLAQGTKGIISYLKNTLKRPASEWEKAQAFLIATRTELYYICNPDDVIKYNSKSYCHVFHKDWLDFSIGWSNQNGIVLNGYNINLGVKPEAWMGAIKNLFNQERTTLVAGEVYVCARFSNVWRGMKIIKKTTI